ncbi:MAG: SDR family NAD(P)-dependent oxidoreductase [Patescibacteria group bacterium]
MFDLSGKSAVITGARRGIGKGIAFTLAQAGADVVVSDIDLEDCEKTCQEIVEKTGQCAVAFKCDVTKKEEVHSLVDKAVGEFGKLDILVNNAGIAPFREFLKISEEEWDKVLEVNLKGQFLCAQVAAKEMAKNGWGRIINIASIASGQVGVGFPQTAHYTASKGGVTAVTETMALELGPKGIRVNAIGPGIIATEMTQDMLSDDEQKRDLLERTPVGRIGKPEDIGAAAVYLASEEADFVNGVTLFVDGGWLAG